MSKRPVSAMLDLITKLETQNIEGEQLMARLIEDLQEYDEAQADLAELQRRQSVAVAARASFIFETACILREIDSGKSASSLVLRLPKVARLRVVQ